MLKKVQVVHSKRTFYSKSRRAVWRAARQRPSSSGRTVIGYTVRSCSGACLKRDRWSVRERAARGGRAAAPPLMAREREKEITSERREREGGIVGVRERGSVRRYERTATATGPSYQVPSRQLGPVTSSSVRSKLGTSRFFSGEVLFT